MKVCQKCGNQVADGLLFCSQCGTPVTSESLTKEKTDATTDRLEALSLQMRSLCDEMTASYIRGVKEIDIVVSRVKEKAEESVQDLRLQLQEKTKDNERLTSRIQELEGNINRLSTENQKIREELERVKKMAEEKEKTVGPIEPEQTFCPKCKAPTDSDMMFCVNCGTRLR